MFKNAKSQFDSQLRGIREEGLFKSERILASPQNARVDLPTENGVLNLCANNYLGLANHAEVVRAAHEALDRWGYGLSSVRFICGTQEVHKKLEGRLSEFLGMDDTILYSSCFDANGGLFETRSSRPCTALHYWVPRGIMRKRAADLLLVWPCYRPVHPCS
jgi:glycine C-acetyltransferase